MGEDEIAPVIAGMDLEWYAVDREGRVAFFTTAGWGPIPSCITRDVARIGTTIKDHLLNAPAVCRGILAVKRKGRLDDWVRAADHGFFAYDYVLHKGPYTLVAYPETPIVVSMLPQDLQNALLRVTLDRMSFADNRTLNAQEYIACSDV